MLRQPEAQKFADRSDSWRLTQEEAAQELTRLCNVREKILAEIRSLEAVYKTVCDRNDYVRGQLRAAYATVDGKDESAEPQALGPYRFPYARLETWGILVESNIPEVRQPKISLDITSPTQGAFMIALHYKGREKALLTKSFNIDYLLAKQKESDNNVLDLEYVQLNVPKLLGLLNTFFTRR